MSDHTHRLGSTCETCAHWVGVHADRMRAMSARAAVQGAPGILKFAGQCRKRAPILVSEDLGGRGKWPMTLSIEWCGDYQAVYVITHAADADEPERVG